MQPLSPQAFAILDRPDQLDALVDLSFRQPVLIIKHSPACGTSVQALDDLEENRDRLAGLEVRLIDVLQQRALSQAIATRFRVRHESPQVLLLVNGRVCWNASHFRVTAEAVRRALAAASVSDSTA